MATLIHASIDFLQFSIQTHCQIQQEFLRGATNESVLSLGRWNLKNIAIDSSLKLVVCIINDMKPKEEDISKNWTLKHTYFVLQTTCLIARNIALYYFFQRELNPTLNIRPYLYYGAGVELLTQWNNH